MPVATVQWIALFGFVGVGLLFLTELLRWRQFGSMIGRRQRTLRVCLILLVEALFVMMYMGPFVSGRRDPLGELLYWTLCLLLGLAVIGLALADVREVVKGYARECRRTFSDIGSESRREK